MVSRPRPPDPYQTAQAQSQMNRDTAITQQELNMVNQTGPWGSVNYAQTGVSENGTPMYTQTTSLSPGQQQIFDRTQAAQGNMAQIAQDQTAFLQQYLQGGVDLSGLPELAGAGDFSADRQRVEDALWDRMSGDRETADANMRSTLAAKGITEGSAAWDAEMERMARQNTDARLATILAGGQEQSRLAQLTNSTRAQGVAEAFAARNQPLNEIAALMSGTQVQAPGQMYSGTPQTGVAGVDYTGMVNNNYNQQVQAHQGMMGGIGGLFGLALGPQGFLR